MKREILTAEWPDDGEQMLLVAEPAFDIDGRPEAVYLSVSSGPMGVRVKLRVEHAELLADALNEAASFVRLGGGS